MKLIEGSIPKGKVWRCLVLFAPDQEPGLSWQFARQLARASDGEVLGLAILPETSTENAVRAASLALSHARDLVEKDDIAHTLVVETGHYRQALLEIIEDAGIDLLLADGDSPQWQRLDRLPCAAAIIRGGAYSELQTTEAVTETEDAHSAANTSATTSDPRPFAVAQVKRILVPTAGGPNSAQALMSLLPLAPDVSITALYVAPEYLGSAEVAHGEARLRQLLRFVDAGNRIERRVVQPENVMQGIIQEAGEDYDLVIIGASRESTIDRALFGDVVGTVIRESKTPVAVFWEPSSAVNDFWRGLAWRLQHILPRLALNQRTEVYVRVRRSARPNTDFFILIGLSTLIASLGLLLSSPAVVIGAMLVAPLMSPMIGAGLAIVLGNPRFIRLSLGAVLKGTLLAIFLGFLTGLIRANTPLTPEILARTQPTLLDLGVAVFAGFAGAYALARSEAAAALPGVAIAAALVPPLSSVGIAFATGNYRESAGALLLYSTNLVAIIAAAVLVFLALGFRPAQTQKAQRAIQQRTVRIAVVLLFAITAVLGITTVSLAREAQLNARVIEVVQTYTNEVEGVEFADLEVLDLTDSAKPLTLNLTVRSTRAIGYSTVETLRDQIAADLQPSLADGRGLALTLTVIRVTMLDPEIPPTPTPTAEPPTPTPEPLLTPSPAVP